MVCALQLPSSAHASWFSVLPSEIPETPIDNWEPQSGDALIADTETNIGYLIHSEGGFTSFPIATGQRKIVRYIGRTYNAATPNRHWISLSKEIKDDRTTFGKDGVFFRLSYKDEGTSYGIHSHAAWEAMLGHQMRYRSMGCIIVSPSVLDIVGETFSLNNDALQVVTVDGFDDDGINYVTLKSVLQYGV